MELLSLWGTGCHNRVYRSEDVDAFWRRTSFGHGIAKVLNSMLAENVSNSSASKPCICGTIVTLCLVSGCKPSMRNNKFDFNW